MKDVKHAILNLQLLIGDTDLTKPGMIRRLFVADEIGHKVMPSGSVTDRNCCTVKYAFASDTDRGRKNYQLGTVSRDTLRKWERYDISNDGIEYFYFIYMDEPLAIKSVYMLKSELVFPIIRDQLNRKPNGKGQINILDKWVKDNARMIYELESSTGFVRRY